MPPVAGSLVWLKADAGTYQDVAGTTAADTDGQVVGLWQDQSGNGNHFCAAADNTTRPTLQTNEINSLPVIRADGSNDRLYSAASLTLTQFTIHVVFVPTATAEDRRILYQYDGTDYWFLNNSTSNTLYQGHPTAVINGAWTLNAPTIVTIQFAADTMYLRINGAQVDALANTAQETIAALNLFASSAAANFAHVDMAELLVYSSALSGTDIASNESYLATRYDIDLETDGTQLLWVKSDTEVYQDVAATTLADDDTEVVGYWKDQSGKGNHLTAVSDGTQRGTLQTDEINGLPVVRMDGTNDYLKTNSPLWLREFTATFVVVPREYCSTHNYAPRIIYQNDSVDGWWLSPWTGGGFYNLSPAVTAAAAIDTYAPNLITLERGSDYIAFRRNGEEVDRQTLASLPTTIAAIYLSGDYALGATSFFDGDYAEVILRRGVDTDARDADESYLSTRYDIPLVETDAWEQLSDMPAARAQHGFEELGGLLYAVAGITSATEQDTNYAYDPETDTWEDGLTDLPEIRQSPALRAVGAKLYCIGGMRHEGASSVVKSTVYEYDPTLDSWDTLTAMPSAREDMGSAVVSGKIYIFGGLLASATPTNVLEVYDPALDSWDESLADMSANKWSGDFGCAIGGKVYAVGSVAIYTGYPTLTAIYTVYEYDIATDTWSALANCPGGTSYKEVVTDGTYLYLIGGATLNCQTFNRSVWRYDPAEDRWDYLCAAPYAAMAIGAVYYDGAIYISGGYDYAADPYNGAARDDLWKLVLSPTPEPPAGGGRVWVCLI